MRLNYFAYYITGKNEFILSRLIIYIDSMIALNKYQNHHMMQLITNIILYIYNKGWP